MPHAAAPHPHTASRLALSELAPGAMQSEIRAMTTECDRIGGINLAQGVCDTPVPPPVEAEALAAIHAGHNIYTRLDGITRLRNAIAAKQEKDYGLTYDPETEVLVASGATGGLHAAAMALLNPHDEVLLFEPFYGYHVATLKSMRVKPVLVPLAEPDWTLDTDALHAAVTPRTRAILLNTPANPSGKIFSLPEIEAVAAVCREHDLFLFTDEIYEYFVYDGHRHICPATLARHARAHHCHVGILQDLLGHRLASRLRHRPRAVDGRHVLLPRPHLRLRALRLSARRRRRPRAVAAQLLHRPRRATTRTSANASSPPCATPAWSPAFPPEPTTSSPRPLGSPAKPPPKKPAIFSPPPESPPSPAAPSSAPAAAKTCCSFCFAKKDDDLNEACTRLRKL